MIEEHKGSEYHSKLSLVNTPKVISSSKKLVTNESGALHESLDNKNAAINNIKVVNDAIDHALKKLPQIH